MKNIIEWYAFSEKKPNAGIECIIFGEFESMSSGTYLGYGIGNYLTKLGIMWSKDQCRKCIAWAYLPISMGMKHYFESLEKEKRK